MEASTTAEGQIKGPVRFTFPRKKFYFWLAGILLFLGISYYLGEWATGGKTFPEWYPSFLDPMFFVIGMGIYYIISTVIVIAFVIATIRFVIDRIERRREAKCSAKASREYAERLSEDQKIKEIQNAAIQADRAIPRKAYLHNFKPKVALETLPMGKTRHFWINVQLGKAIVKPTNDHRIHHVVLDITQRPAISIMGSPHYDRVLVDGADQLVIMGVVYTLKTSPSEW